MASLWEKFESGVKKRVASSVQGYDYDQDWLKVAGEFVTGGGYDDSWIIDMQERIYPSALKKGTMKKWKKGDLKKGKKPPIRIQERIDQMLLSSGGEPKYGTIVESKHTPGVGAEEGEKFYTFKDSGQMSDIYKGLKTNVPWMEKETKRIKEENIQRKKRGEKPLTTMFNVGYKKDVEKGDSKFVNPGVIGMARYQVGVGEDSKGKYMSIYDKWDLDPSGGFVNKVGDWAMPGFEMYDRIYYEDKKKPKLRRAKSETKIAKVKVKPEKRKKIRLRDRTNIDDKVFGFLKKGAGKIRDWAEQEVKSDRDFDSPI